MNEVESQKAFQLKQEKAMQATYGTIRSEARQALRIFSRGQDLSIQTSFSPEVVAPTPSVGISRSETKLERMAIGEPLRVPTEPGQSGGGQTPPLLSVNDVVIDGVLYPTVLIPVIIPS